MLKRTLALLCLIAGLADSMLPKPELVCRSTQILPKGYPCYLPNDVEGWIKVLVTNGCNEKTTDEEFEKFYKCLCDNCPDYVKSGDSVVRYPLQCGEKLLDNSGLPKNATTWDTIRLYCKHLPCNVKKVDPKSKLYRLVACAMHEYTRKFELRYADWRTFKCHRD